MLTNMRWDHLRLDGLTESGPRRPAPGRGALGGSRGQEPRRGRWPAGRWREPGAGPPGGALFERGAITRTFDTPGFRGMTFYEIQAKSIVNRVPATSRMAFDWTINPYRGCQHACAYCQPAKRRS